MGIVKKDLLKEISHLDFGLEVAIPSLANKNVNRVLRKLFFTKHGGKMNLIKSFALVLAATSIVACTESKKSENGVETLNVSNITANSKLSSVDKAEKFALLAEQLFSLTNFMHSADMADLALELDPQNQRAQFYKKAAGPLLALKGIVTRIKPSLNPNDVAHYNDQIDNFPDSALKTFLLDGTEDIKDEKSIQAFIDSYIVAMNDMRVFLKSFKGTDLTLNANDWSWAAFSQHKLKECIAMMNGYGEYVEFKCPMKKAGQIKLNTADMAVLQQAYAAYQLFFTIYNVYDLTGMKALAQLPEDTVMSGQEAWNFLAKNQDFGVYRSTSQLQLVKEMGLDFIGASRWAIKMQKQLCPQGYETEKNRPGYLFHSGLCVENKDESSESLELVEAILNGGLMPFTATSADGAFDYQTEVKPVLMFTQPVQDLKALKPVFKTCGDEYGEYTSIVQIADSTLNGLFPNGDVNYILRIQDTCAQ